jgi:hypothetical protein
MVPGPVVPPPPGLFSTITGCPRFLPASSASARMCRSVEPPAGQGQISVIGRLGKLCARAGKAASVAAPAAAMSTVRREAAALAGVKGEGPRVMEEICPWKRFRFDARTVH